MKICGENPNLVKMGGKYRALYMKKKLSFIVAATSDPHKRALFE
jgi:hypothetical protein